MADDVDYFVSFPARGMIRLQSRALFANAEAPACRRFVECVLHAAEITRVTIRGGPSPHADLRFRPRTSSLEHVLERVIARLRDSNATGSSDAAIRLDEPGHPHRRDRILPPGRPDAHRALCTAALTVATAQFAAPGLLPAAAGLLAAAALPTFRRTQRNIFREGRLGPELLDSLVIAGCLATLSIFPGAMLCWCRSLAPALARRTRDDSLKLLLDDFDRRPRQARLEGDGVQTIVPADHLQHGDRILIEAGEIIPADGRIVAGRAMIDLHALTSQSATEESGVGDRVFAATLIVAGAVRISVESVGSETASARIGQNLADAAGHETTLQERAQRAADAAVIPSLALGAIGMATLGAAGALALLQRDVGSGIRMAAPLSIIGAVALGAHAGIIIKDGRALECLSRVGALVIDEAVVPFHQPAELVQVIREFRRRGIRRIACLSADRMTRSARLAESLGMALISNAERAALVERLRHEVGTVCFVGCSTDEPLARHPEDVSISMGGLGSIASDTAQIVVLGGSLAKVCDLHDIARDLERALRQSRWTTLAPNIVCVLGVFTMGLGLTASVVINNVATLAALGIGAIPLRTVAGYEAERRHRRQFQQSVASRRNWQHRGPDTTMEGHGIPSAAIPGRAGPASPR